MDTLRLLLWFSMTAAVLHIYCAADPLEGRAGGGKQGCVVGPARPCGKNNKFICRRILKQPENGGTPCPPEVERNDPNRPAENNHLCMVGVWSACFPLPGYPHIMVKRREPLDMTADISTCPDLVAPCNINIPVDCVMTDWSEWYQFDADGIEVRVRFVLVEPQHGGTACPHDMEIRPIAYCGTWSAWSNWAPVGGGACTTDQERFRYSSYCTAERETRACPNCGTWSAWSNWAPVGGGACTTDQERFRYSSYCPAERETRACPNCGTWSAWSNWAPVGGGACTTDQERFRYSSYCPAERETRACPNCGTWSAWSNWAPVGGGACTTDQERFRYSSYCPAERETRACPNCGTWSAWSNWAPVGGGACTTDQERFRYSSYCPAERETRACQCTWTYTNWAIISVDPCKQGRYKYNPCYANQQEERDCIDVCIAPNVFNPLRAAGGMILEARAGSIARKKRNDPWCPEDPWIIYGTDDGCTAVKNVTYFRCTEKNCQNHASSQGGVICVPDKFTDLTIYLENCPWISGGHTEVIVNRPMECVCHQVAGDTCTKFLSP